MSRPFDIPRDHFRKALQAIFPGRGASIRRSPTVLVVDDEPLIVQGIAAILNLEGFTVLTAFDAQSALKLVQKTSPELLISDVNMPGIDGIELAMRLVTVVPTMKVLLFSGDFAILQDNFRHQEEHPFVLLAKPVPPQQMLEQVRATLEGVPAKRAPKPHNAPAQDEVLVMGSRPRTNRRTSLPAPLEPTSPTDAESPDSLVPSVDARLRAKRYFLKTVESQTPHPLPRTYRPSFFQRSASTRMTETPQRQSYH